MTIRPPDPDHAGPFSAAWMRRRRLDAELRPVRLRGRPPRPPPPATHHPGAAMYHLGLGKGAALFGAGLSFLGAIDHDQAIAWGGFLLAGSSAVATWAWSQYHQWREARRKEDTADAAAETEAIRHQLAAQLELEARAAANAARIDELDAKLERIYQRVGKIDAKS